MLSYLALRAWRHPATIRESKALDDDTPGAQGALTTSASSSHKLMAARHGPQVRIASAVKSTQKITKAMKMVAAAKLRRPSERRAGRPYSTAAGSSSLARRAGPQRSCSACFAARQGYTHLIVVATATAAAGAFNTNIVAPPPQGARR
jgi:hypothetical protein